MDPSVLVRVLSQRYGITPLEYTHTRTFQDFSQDAIGWYSEVLAPVAAIAEALGGGEEDEKPRRPARGAPNTASTTSRVKKALPKWVRRSVDGPYQVHYMGKKGEAPPPESVEMLKVAWKGLGGRRG